MFLNMFGFLPFSFDYPPYFVRMGIVKIGQLIQTSPQTNGNGDRRNPDREGFFHWNAATLRSHTDFPAGM
jgi:hypothetical protein